MRSIEGSTTAISSIATPRSSVPICTIFGSLPVTGIVAEKVCAFSTCWIRERLTPCLRALLATYTSNGTTQFCSAQHCQVKLCTAIIGFHVHAVLPIVITVFFLLKPRSSCSSRDGRTPAPAGGRHILSGVGRGHRRSSSVFRGLTVEEPLDHLARPASDPSIVLEQPARLPRRIAEHVGNAGTIA